MSPGAANINFALDSQASEVAMAANVLRADLDVAIGAVRFDPILPIALVLAVALIALILTSRAVGDDARRSSAVVLSPMQRALLYTLRAVTMAGVVLILMNPVRPVDQAEIEQTARLPLFLLVDDSASMCTEDVYLDGAEFPVGRFEAIRQHWLDERFLADLRERAFVRWYFIGDDVTATNTDSISDHRPDASESRLSVGLERVARTVHGTDAAAIILLSDGRDTSGRPLVDAAPGLQSIDVPVFAVPVGTSSRAPDVAVRLLPDQSFIYRGQRTVLRAEVDQVGFDGEVVALTLLADGVPIEERRLLLDESASRVAFEVVPDPQKSAPAQPGPAVAEYELVAETLPGERLTENNRRLAFIQVDDEFLRVAVFENEPYWDTRFLIDALRRDPQIEITTFIGINDRIEHIVRHSAGHASPDTPSSDEDADEFLSLGAGSAIDILVPESADELAEYDIVILGRRMERWFGGNRAALLRDYVLKQGGSLVFSRGEPFSRDDDAGIHALDLIGSISPVEWGRDLLEPGGPLLRTPEVRRGDPLDFTMIGDTDQILTSLPRMVAQTRIAREKAVSTIWLRSGLEEVSGANDTPRTGGVEHQPAAVAHLRAGRGQVMAVLTHGLWQWALLPSEQKQMEPVFDLFWTRAVRWLAGQAELLPGQSVRLSIDRFIHEPGDNIELFVQTRFADVEADSFDLRVRGPTGRETSLTVTQVPGRSGLFRAAFRPEAGGVYESTLTARRLVPQTQQLRFAVYDPTSELLDTSADTLALRLLAEATGGDILAVDAPRSILEILGAAQAARRTTPELQPGWTTWWVMALLLAAACGEWWLRRRWLFL